MTGDLRTTLVVATAAAFLGLLANAALEWIRQWVQASQKQSSIRRVLLEELAQAERTAEGCIQALNRGPPDEGHGALVPISERFPFYEHHLGEIGLLTSTEVSLVAAAYTQLRAFPEKLLVVGDPQRKEGRLYIWVRSDLTHVVTAQFQGVLDMVRPATQELRRLVK